MKPFYSNSPNSLNNSSSLSYLNSFSTGKKFKLSALILASIALTACGSAVSVSTKKISTQLLNERTNIVTNNKLSINSIGKLRTAGLDQKSCFATFEQCLSQLSESQFVAHSPRQLALLAELHYAKAEALKSSRECRNTTPQYSPDCLLQYHSQLFEAVKYSYAYLFRDSLSQKVSNLQNTLPNELDIQTQDIYNSATNALVSTLYKTGKSEVKTTDPNINIKEVNIEGDHVEQTINLANHVYYDNDIKDRLKNPQLQVMTSHIAGNTIKIFMPNDPAYLQSPTYPNNLNSLNKASINNNANEIENLIPTSSLSMNGLASISKRAGFGISYIAQQNNRETLTVRQLVSSDDEQTTNKPIDLTSPETRIYPNGNLLMTAILQPMGDNISEVLSSKQFKLNLYNPYRTTSVNILGKNYSLAGNFSASYAIWVNENNFTGVSYLNMLQKNQNLPLPRLYMLEPYDPNKRIIIMVHGLASSPDTWVGVTNDILNDEILRDNFQVWQIAYSTNLPMIENRYHLQQLINTAYQQVDPTKENIAGKHSVLIGHSMGSILSRMMVSDDDLTQNLDKLISHQDKNDLKQRKLSENLSQAYKQSELAPRFQLKSLQPIDTAVFISAPFRGTTFADRWFTKALRDIIQLPLDLTINEDMADLNNNPLGALFLENGASQLSDQSSFIELTKDIRINPKVTYHSIMGNYTSGILSTINKDTSLQRNSDGIVPYASSYLAGAKTETVLEGGHDIHTNPKTITQLRKILHQHLNKYPTEK